MPLLYILGPSSLRYRFVITRNQCNISSRIL